MLRTAFRKLEGKLMNLDRMLVKQLINCLKLSETVNKLSKTEGGQIWCPVPAVGTRCPDSSVFHYFRCCGTLNNECCLKLQTWAFVLLVAVGVLIASLILLSVIRCVFCRRK
uniref:Uncharacterized protein n=1 Tax=Meloidogyne incognita TaxID=6306 RepID=A0A914LXS1_MELIC